MVETLAALDAGVVSPRPQSEDDVTYAHKIDKAEARIDWTRPGPEVDCHIRGLSPFPGAWCEIGGERVKILLSKSEPEDGTPGAALDNGLLIACGSGAVRLTRLQRAGKKPGDAADFLRGLPVPKGTVLP
jgi:methionyl-tRNA formyltransferase